MFSHFHISNALYLEREHALHATKIFWNKSPVSKAVHDSPKTSKWCSVLTLHTSPVGRFQSFKYNRI